MTQQVRVRRLNPDGTAQVIHTRQSACSGDCHKCSGCGAAQETLMFTAHNPIGAQPGELVIVKAKTAPVLVAAVIMYILPLVLFFLGYLLGHILWEQGGITGCVAFAFGIGGSVCYDRLVARKQKTVYTITGYGKAEPFLAAEGDNDLD